MRCESPVFQRWVRPLGLRVLGMRDTQFLSRLNFQTKIVAITLTMVILVVVLAGVAIDRTILPVLEGEVHEQAWRVGYGVLEQIRSVRGNDQASRLQALLSPLFQCIPSLLYVELLEQNGNTLYWEGDPKFRAAAGGCRVIEQNESGTLALKYPPSGEMIYEVMLNRDEKPVGPGLVRVRIGMSAGFVESLSRRMFWMLFGVALLLVIVSFFVTRLFTRMITRPVDRLLRMTCMLAKGQLDEVVAELREIPGCAGRAWRGAEGGTAVAAEPEPSFCPLLSREGGGPTGSGPVQEGFIPPCEACEVSRPSCRDELSRLLFTFQYMAAEIRAYQEKLMRRYEFEELLLEACPDGIMANDSRGKIILYSKGAERLLGYSLSEALHTLPVHRIYPEGEPYRIKKALMSDEFGGPGVLLDYTTQVIRKDGRAIPIRLSATIVCKEQEEIAVVGYFHDLTELNEHMSALVKANEQLDQSNRDLARLNRHYLEMLSFVTHELKSPIANSFMSANALRQQIFGELAPEQMVMVEAVCRNLDQSMEMIRHYLDLSRIEKDEFLIQPQKTRILADVVQPVLKGLSSTIQEQDVAIAIEVDPGLEWVLDPELFRGVLTNLVSNALKYGEKCGKVRIAALEREGGCRLEVWNSGPGIPEESREKLFQKFQRLHTAQQPSVRGTGLGLFITKTVVERHGGTITVESSEGEWASFRIDLPKPGA